MAGRVSALRASSRGAYSAGAGYVGRTDRVHLVLEEAMCQKRTLRRLSPCREMVEFLLGFDGRIHYLEHGYWLKFEAKQIEPTAERPHGLRYSLTLHDPNGKRLIGFDNAHSVPAQGSHFQKSHVEHDHWQRTADDVGDPTASRRSSAAKPSVEAAESCYVF